MSRDLRGERASALKECSLVDHDPDSLISHLAAGHWKGLCWGSAKYSKANRFCVPTHYLKKYPGSSPRMTESVCRATKGLGVPTNRYSEWILNSP